MQSSLKSIFQGDQVGFSGLAANYKSLKKIITEKLTKKIRMCVYLNGFFHAFVVRQLTEDVIKRIILVCKSLHKTWKLESVYECQVTLSWLRASKILPNCSHDRVSRKVVSVIYFIKEAKRNFFWWVSKKGAFLRSTKVVPLSYYLFIFFFKV